MTKIVEIVWTELPEEGDGSGPYSGFDLSSVFESLPGGEAVCHGPSYRDFLDQEEFDQASPENRRWLESRAEEDYWRARRDAALKAWESHESLEAWMNAEIEECAKPEYMSPQKWALAMIPGARTKLYAGLHPPLEAWDDTNTGPVPKGALKLVTPTSGRVVWHIPEKHLWGVWFGDEGSIVAAGLVLSNAVRSEPKIIFSGTI